MISTRRTTQFDAALIAICTIAIFMPVMWTPFSPLDDYAMLRFNPLLQEPSFSGLVREIGQARFSIYAPLTYMVFHAIALVNAATHANAVIAFKIVSLLAHVGTSISAFWVFRLLLKSRMAAICGALLVSIHPLQVESVAWTTGLKDELCGLLSFLTIALYVKYLREDNVRTTRWFIVTAIFAMLAKPTAVVLPAVLLVVDWAVKESSWVARWHRMKLLIFPAAICLLINWNVQEAATVPRIAFWQRPLVAMDALTFYLSKSLWPMHLAVDYARTPDVILNSHWIYWTWIPPVLVATAVIVSRSRKIVLAAAVFVIPLLPVLGLVTFDMQQYSTVADHYAYQSMLGFGLLAGLLIQSLPRMRVAALIAIALLSVASVRQLLLWQDQRALYLHAIAMEPRAFMSRGCLAVLAMERGDLMDAEQHARAAVAMRDDVTACDTLAAVLQQSDQLDESARLARRAMELGPDKLAIPRFRQIIQLGRQIEDFQLVRQAATIWAKREPKNPIPRVVLLDVAHSSTSKQ